MTRNVCCIEGCSDFVRGLGYCNKHYLRMRDGRPLHDVPPRTCAVEGCDTSTTKGAGGLCGMHYARKRRGRDVGAAGYQRDPRRTIEQRVFDRLCLNETTGCWEWTGSLARSGYGAVGHMHKVLLVHRWVYEHLVAEIPEGLVIDHLCNNRRCANPEHLDPVTRAVNNERGDHGLGVAS